MSFLEFTNILNINEQKILKINFLETCQRRQRKMWYTDRKVLTLMYSISVVSSNRLLYLCGRSLLYSIPEPLGVLPTGFS